MGVVTSDDLREAERGARFWLEGSMVELDEAHFVEGSGLSGLAAVLEGCEGSPLREADPWSGRVLRNEDTGWSPLRTWGD